MYNIVTSCIVALGHENLSEIYVALVWRNKESVNIEGVLPIDFKDVNESSLIVGLG